uniref:Uncharacterized protein n=1 Tax=Picea glauca TaxID=3330 RepID=A0A117NFH1_PICGL|nr:hypothetical protein ABT39_MTgene3528 [Picea glauca]KUM45215.1 hypothetical protein ABT39_MTgene3538 [Picea glauca]KUM45915.1 hypothetical protein ABT39_MTgene2269 [Picea glauca]QHR88147.1 hypothetical protein Q903MT_gene2160 [Picea sitchensis]
MALYRPPAILKGHPITSPPDRPRSTALNRVSSRGNSSELERLSQLFWSRRGSSHPKAIGVSKLFGVHFCWSSLSNESQLYLRKNGFLIPSKRRSLGSVRSIKLLRGFKVCGVKRMGFRENLCKGGKTRGTKSKSRFNQHQRRNNGRGWPLHENMRYLLAWFLQ